MPGVTNIDHDPIFDPVLIEKLYSEKDGVPVKYVCTSAPNKNATYSADIFFRETPHPEFGNRYFGLYRLALDIDDDPDEQPRLMITNCDVIEDLEFGMVKGSKGWVYSQHRHDYRSIDNTSAIDGGRSYVKRAGDINAPYTVMKIIDGKFEEV